jgi:nicotinamide phosphoribosyltransferase
LEERVKKVGGFQIVSAVADTYDTFRFAKYIGVDFHDRIKNSGGKFVVRPDSGDPIETPVRVVKELMEHVGYTVNSKGYKLLPPYLGVLQGDGINEKSIGEILKLAMEEKLSPLNFVFGMGGALLQHCDRDWAKFAMKCSAIKLADEPEWKDVFKDPITDKGKTSLKGRVHTVQMIDGSIQTVRLEETEGVETTLMDTIFKDGKLLVDLSFDEVRANMLKSSCPR